MEFRWKRYETDGEREADKKNRNSVETFEKRKEKEKEYQSE
jgi:hypothetical protein